MVRKIYEVEYDDNLHMADAKDDPDAKRAMLFDDDNNLKGHAKLHEIDEDDLRDRFASSLTAEEGFVDHAHRSSECVGQANDETVAALIGLGTAAIAIFVVSSAPHVRNWWEKTAAPGFDAIIQRVSEGFKNVVAGVKGFLPAGDKKEPNQASSSSLQLAKSILEIDPKLVQSEVDSAFHEYREDIDSKEAQKTLVEIVMLAAMLAERIERLSNACVVSDETSIDYIGWRDTAAHITSKELIDAINLILEGDASLLDKMQLDQVEQMLGRNLYPNGSFEPIGANEMLRLLPQIRAEMDDGGRNQAGNGDDGTLPTCTV
jgi:hypothetical protein